MEIPCFWPFFQEVTGQLDHPVADFRKKVGNSPPPPRWTIRRGKPALFSEIRREGSLTARQLPRTVFLEGGGLYNPLVV